MKIIEKLQNHFEQIKNVHLWDLKQQDSNRFEKLSINTDKLFVGFSTQKMTVETFELLFELAEKCNVAGQLEALMSGEKLNITENRAALHSALRASGDTQLFVDGENIIPRIQSVLAKMVEFSKQVRNGSWLGFSHKKIKTIVNIGIGGSDLGPRTVTLALEAFADGPEIRFVSNVDSTDFYLATKDLNPDTTLFIIVSKTFGTRDTLDNAKIARDWLLSFGCPKEDIAKHFVAVSSEVSLAKDFGIAEANIFPMFEWVGGRFSIWSAVGLSLMLSIGEKKFREFLSGARWVDEHVLSSQKNKNIPLCLALIEHWNTNFFKYQTRVVLPYDSYLRFFPAYLQQLEMESNGKSARLTHDNIGATAPIVWGYVGTDSQHSFFQLLHQSSQIVPSDFILVVKGQNEKKNSQLTLLSNALAQSYALAYGDRSLENFGKNLDDKFAKHKSFLGNRPSTVILLEELTAYSLGQLIAIYEHKVFIESVLWDINPFDQMGVSLGKSIALEFEKRLNSNAEQEKNLDLLNMVKIMRNSDKK